jgi:hypothetical protein
MQQIYTAIRIVTEFCDVTNIAEFECRAHFPAKIEVLFKATEADGEVNDTQLIHQGEVAGMIANLKDLIMRIENAELIRQSHALHDATAECERLNEEIGREHAKRILNKEARVSKR